MATKLPIPLTELVKCPPVAWPTVALFFLCYGIIGTVWYVCVAAIVPLWAGAIINGITAYFLFSVVHDSSHKSLSRHNFINEMLGRIGLVYFAPLAPMDVARYIHMAHHKFANDPVKDPDAYSHKLDWFFPIRWANFDYFYTKFFFQQGGAFAKRKYPALAAYVTFILGCAAFISWAGYGYELLILWFVPTRISSFLFVFVFSFLAHQPFETLARDDEYRATALRLGANWLLSPLMANHNYHLIHHLHTSAPFYRYQKIWALREAELRQHQLLTPPTFGLSQPTIH